MVNRSQPDDMETVWWFEGDNGKEGYVHIDPYCAVWSGVNRDKTVSGPYTFAEELELCVHCCSDFIANE